LKHPVKTITSIGCAIIGLIVTGFILLTIFGSLFHQQEPPISKTPPNISSIHQNINITSPQNGDIWYAGKPASINWASDFPQGTSFRINLNYNGKDYPIGTTDTRSFTWNVTDQIIASEIRLEVAPWNVKYSYEYSHNLVYITIAK